METVLVAGGAGFIGSNLCESLLEGKLRVICVDNLITGDKNNIQDILLHPKFSFIKRDITEPILNFKFKISNIKYIFHLASPASPNKRSPLSYINHPIETLAANSTGAYQLLELARKTKARFVYASSSEVYGDPTVSPQAESYFGNVNPNGVRSVYDEGKRFGEAITMAYVRKYGLNARIVRIFNTYGPKMQKDDGRVVSNFISQTLSNKPITIYGDGTQTRSFCYISDMVDGLKTAMFTKDARGEVINLGNPDERKITDLATIIKKLTNSSSEIVFEDLPEDDPRIRKPDIEKAKKILGWSPRIRLEEGLKNTIEYFKSLQ